MMRAFFGLGAGGGGLKDYMKYEIAIGRPWGTWDSISIHAESENEAHTKILEDQIYEVSFAVTLHEEDEEDEVQ